MNPTSTSSLLYVSPSPPSLPSLRPLFSPIPYQSLEGKSKQPAKTTLKTVTIRLPTSLLMMPMRLAFFKHSLHDSALFHTFLSHYAASFHTSYPQTTSEHSHSLSQSNSHSQTQAGKKGRGSRGIGGGKQTKSDPEESIYHRTMAIKILNERIRLGKGELSDGSVAVVANLAIYEVCFASLTFLPPPTPLLYTPYPCILVI